MSADLPGKLRDMSSIYMNNAVARRVLLDAAEALEAQPKQDTARQPFWIVMALDNPGPVERGLGSYVRHPHETAAETEARRLAGIHGGRFAVLRATHVIGWQEVALGTADLEIPL